MNALHSKKKKTPLLEYLIGCDSCKRLGEILNVNHNTALSFRNVF